MITIARQVSDQRSRSLFDFIAVGGSVFHKHILLEIYFRNVMINLFWIFIHNFAFLKNYWINLLFRSVAAKSGTIRIYCIQGTLFVIWSMWSVCVSFPSMNFFLTLETDLYPVFAHLGKCCLTLRCLTLLGETTFLHRHFAPSILLRHGVSNSMTLP